MSLRCEPPAAFAVTSLVFRRLFPLSRVRCHSAPWTITVDSISTNIGRHIGKYEVTGVLGRGGMGVVYQAEDKRIGRLVAIKTLTEGFSSQADMMERFYREAHAGILHHPNIVVVYDLGDEDGIPFIVMEYVEGKGLDRLIASGRELSLIDKLKMVEQICAALGYAHRHGVVHRDIKPANVIVQPDGVPKIVDFGIARMKSTDSGLTRTGTFVGTIDYMAPERLKGQPFDGRSDIFSTGVMLYLLLTGHLPFSGEDLAVLHQLVNTPHPPLGACLSGHPSALDGIIDRALAKDPDRRYATAEEFGAALHAVIECLSKTQVAVDQSSAEATTALLQPALARAAAAHPEPASLPVAAPRRKGALPVVLAVLALMVLATGGGLLRFHHGAAIFLRKVPGFLPPAAANASARATAPPMGILFVQGNVEGVNVLVDGPVQGVTQSDGTLKLPLGAGTHAIRLSKAGYTDYPDTRVQIVANQEADLHFTLTKFDPPMSPVETEGNLNLHTIPAALVKVDHVPMGNADARGSIVVPLKPGNHSLEISRDGYEPRNEGVVLEAGEKKYLTALLSPVEAPVQSLPVDIVTFFASDEHIQEGQSTTLKWETTNATQASMDNGIDHVDTNGEITVHPSISTTYVLTAKGLGSAQRRSVTVVVEPKVVKAVSPANGAPAFLALVKAWDAAYNRHDTARMQAIWPGMRAQQVLGLQRLFKSNPSARISDDCPASALSLSGDTATWTCTATTMLPGNGGPMQHSGSISFTFAKRDGNWAILDRH